ncbi:MAG: type II toxin-antitoxin system VapC family toxin [Nocardioidaceae bacterium]
MSQVVVDSSALVAIMTAERSADWLEERLVEATDRVIAAPNAVELGIVLEAKARPDAPVAGVGRRVLRDAGVRVAPFDEELADRAVDAWRRFGKGRHPASLNFGDCCSYALAEQLAAPLLCVGEDFVRTDLDVLVPPG